MHDVTEARGQASDMATPSAAAIVPSGTDVHRSMPIPVMTLRWISAGVGIPLFVVICLWGAVPFAVGITCVAVMGLVEMLKTYQSRGLLPNVLLASAGLLSSIWVMIPEADQRYVFRSALVAIVLAAIVWEVFRAARTGEMSVARNMANGLLCAIYIALFGGLTALRVWPGQVGAGLFPRMPSGIGLVIMVACCVWATDTAALFVGKMAGQQKLAPRLSPAKTVEGAAGGLAGGVVIGALFGWGLLGRPVMGLAIGLIAGVFGQVGDLFESAIKREVDVKDFGSIVPGHGGVLDRFDSLLIVAPMVWLLVWLHRGL